MIRFAIEKLSMAKVLIQRISAGASASRKFSLIKPEPAASALGKDELVIEWEGNWDMHPLLAP